MKEIRKELLDELLDGYEGPEDLLGEEGLLKGVQKALMERAFGAELTEHLGYEKGDPAGHGSGNSRNGRGRKRVLTESGSVGVSVPRDRNGSFEPQLVKKGQSRLPGFDEKVISLYARGMTQREIRGHLEELYAISVSPDLISRVTDAVIEEVKAWQSRPLDPVYAVIFFDAALRAVLRTRQDPRRGHGAEQGGLPGDRHPSGRHQGGPGAMDRADRGREVLAAGHERAQGPGHQGLPDRGGRRPQGGRSPALHAQRRSTRSSPRPWCRPASSTSCATGCPCAPTRTAARWPRT